MTKTFKLRNKVVDWLEAQLSDGPKNITELRHESQRSGFSWRTVIRARQRLKVEARQTWVWCLPGSQPQADSLSPVDFGELPTLPPPASLPPMKEDELLREATMMRMGLGLEDDEIERRLVSLARRRPCSPPLSREDIARIVQS